MTALTGVSLPGTETDTKRELCANRGIGTAGLSQKVLHVSIYQEQRSVRTGKAEESVPGELQL